MGKATGLGKIITWFAERMTPTTPFVKRQRLATKTARIFESHSSKLEQQLKVYAEVNNAVIESNVGLVNWLSPTNPEHEEVLISSRQGFSNFLDALKFTLPSIDEFRKAIADQIGISQDLNSAIVRLTHVLGEIVAEMRKNERQWDDLIKTIDRKLNAW